MIPTSMPDAFGDYKVLERIGSGHQTEVYRARDTRAGRTAVIKVLTADVATDPVRGRPIADDAFLATTLGHPNAAALYEVGEQEGRPYLVYEFVQGQSLKALLAGHPIHPRRAIEFAMQMADALAEAHAVGLVHRTLSPDTVVVSQKGAAKVIDFGLGRYGEALVALGDGAKGGPTTTAYWAPEQRRGDGDHGIDVYALGLLLAEMLTGQPPTPPGDPPNLSNVAPAILAVVTRMLERDAARRVDSAATVAAELRALSATLEAQRDKRQESLPFAPAVDSATRHDASEPPPSAKPPVPASPRDVPRRTPAGDTPSGSSAWLVAAGVVAVVVVLWIILGQ